MHANYHRLQEHESADEGKDYEEQRSHVQEHGVWTTRALLLFLIGTTALSLSLNTFLLLRPQTSSSTSNRAGTSYYANLENEAITRQIHPGDKYVNLEDLNITQKAWEKLSGDPGVVALQDSFVTEKGLPTAMRYPWDDTRGVYLLQGHHNLHCLRTVFRSIMDYHHERPQRIALVHILHCLDELRQDVICKADDTPRFAGYQSPPGTGKNQERKCRDWSKLDAWAQMNTACFKHEDETPDRMVNRFKFCPDGSRPWEGKEPAELEPEGLHIG